MVILVLTMDSISKSEFKAHALQVLREVQQSGKSRIITDHGRPALEIKKLRQSDISALESLRGSVIKFDRPTDPVAADDWENG